VAVASAAPYANHLYLTPDRYHASTLSLSFFTGRMPFVLQQRQSTELIVN